MPLRYRSRFYLAFRGRETFYFEAEKRRLEYMKDKMGDKEDVDPEQAARAKREYAKQQRKLEVHFLHSWMLEGHHRPDVTKAEHSLQT